MSDKLYNTLRTSEQIGYTVSCSNEHSVGGILAYTLTIVADSQKFTPDIIHSKMEQFLQTFCKELEDDELFDEYVASYVKKSKQVFGQISFIGFGLPDQDLLS